MKIRFFLFCLQNDILSDLEQVQARKSPSQHYSRDYNIPCWPYIL